MRASTVAVAAVGAVAVGAAVAAVASGSLGGGGGGGGGGSGPTLLVNGSPGPISVQPSQLTLNVSGGTPGGALVIYVCPSPAVAAACSASPGTDHFDSAGNFTWHFGDYVGVPLFFAMKDVTTGKLSNWVEVTA